LRPACLPFHHTGTFYGAAYTSSAASNAAGTFNVPPLAPLYNRLYNFQAVISMDF